MTFGTDAGLMSRMLDEGMLIPLVAIGCGTLIALVAIVWGATRSMVVAKAREQTKRELAAYVAEGSIDADKAVALMEADKPTWEKGCGVGRRSA